MKKISFLVIIALFLTACKDKIFVAKKMNIDSIDPVIFIAGFAIVALILIFSVIAFKWRKKNEKTKKELEKAHIKMNFHYDIVVHGIYNRISMLRQLSSLNEIEISQIHALAQDTEYILEKLKEWTKHYFKDIELSCDKKTIDLSKYENMFNSLKINQNKISYSFSDVRFIYADETMMEIILENLITNAMKYTQNGNIKVYSKRDETHVKIFIEDTGPGIPPQRLKNIFSVFSEEKGLGIPLSRKLTEAQDGELTVRSTLGKGTVFCIAIPIPVYETERVPMPNI